MIYSVKITPEAGDDLRSIGEYISVNLHSEWAALNQLKRLEKAIRSLDYMPERFRLYDKEPWRSRNMRILVVDNYLVFYIVRESDKTVTVMRVMYYRRDADRQL